MNNSINICFMTDEALETLKENALLVTNHFQMIQIGYHLYILENYMMKRNIRFQNLD